MKISKPSTYDKKGIRRIFDFKGTLNEGGALTFFVFVFFDGSLRLGGALR